MTVRTLNFSRAFWRRGRRLDESVFADAISRHFASIQDELVQLLHTFVQTLTGDRTRRLDVPVVGRAELFESELRLDLRDVEGARKILLVGQDQDRDVASCLPDLEQLQLGLLQSVLLAGVDDEDDAVGASRVRPPKRPQLFLAADIPHKKWGPVVAYLEKNWSLILKSCFWVISSLMQIFNLPKWSTSV